MKSGKQKWIILLAAVVLAAGILLAVAFRPKPPKQAEISTLGISYNCMVADPAAGAEFLRQFGWTAGEPTVDEIIIPAEFNDLYLQYNAIQTAQGLDLLPYAGKTCTRMVFPIENYPNGTDPVQATLLIYQSRVIGGDLCTTALDGWQTGFLGEHGVSDQMHLTSDPEPQAAAALPITAYPTD